MGVLADFMHLFKYIVWFKHRVCMIEGFFIFFFSSLHIILFHKNQIIFADMVLLFFENLWLELC